MTSVIPNSSGASIRKWYARVMTPDASKEEEEEEQTGKGLRGQS